MGRDNTKVLKECMFSYRVGLSNKLTERTLFCVRRGQWVEKGSD